ncbi:MAG: type II toxin-antitoxin system VapC family toxin [Dehalococcoidia bacterium]|nr:type II toxin-antitoxin system VapC family toxin [Dehalococcoidia bacterium]
MIIDSSALCAILFDEPDAARYAAAIAAAETRRVSAVNLLETAIVVESRGGPPGGSQLDALIERAAIEVVPVTVTQIAAARTAWRRFGKGNHPAGLNLGDCLAYALSQTNREPLLFKGRDFVHTDIETA